MIIAVIVAQGIIFLVLILIMRQFMKGHVSGAVDHVQKMNEELMKQQAALKKKLADAEAEYKQKMGQLNQDIDAKQADSRESANKTLEDARENAQKEKERIINEAIATREKMRQEIMAEMEEKAIQHAQGLVGESFDKGLLDMVHDYLVQDVVKGIGEVDLASFQVKEASADLMAARPLSEKSKTEIKKAIESKIDKKIEFNESKDESLVGGVILKFGTFVIDGSLKNRLAETAAKRKKATAKSYQKTT